MNARDTARRAGEGRILLLLADSYQVGGGVEGVAAWWPAQPGWWVEFWDTAGHVDAPVGVVGEFVMPTAQC
ncbi:MAG: hypothetical protein WBF76_13555, partial [Pseudonocardiaceae bacterium]